ncbi:MAG TPA: toll/interleukin-1 receptor domain-containing protein [Longimicrobium sp.]|nr:toll/interleukin-1 receptor domain-containing protein [Longimicrobium sp.]
MEDTMGGHNVFGRPIDQPLQEKSRIFISHRLADKLYARAIAEYFESIGLHYYFDEQDEVLQRAAQEGHSQDVAIVQAIDDGLAHSTHLLAVLSSRTMGSWWVPYEVGAARAMGKDVRHLLLPSLTAEMVPEYLRIYPQFWSARDLFDWISGLSSWREYLVMREYREYLNDIFGELAPDEETIDHWYAEASRLNDNWLRQLDAVFQNDASRSSES